MNESVADLLRRALVAARAGAPMYACVVVKARGSTPQSAGAVMLVDDAARTYGTIGGGCVEAEARRRTLQFMTDRISSSMRFRLDHDFGWDDGLICGGTIDLIACPLPPAAVIELAIADLAAERPATLDFEFTDSNAETTAASRVRYRLCVPPRPRLLIAGAGHVGAAVARHGIALEFDVTLIDDRSDALDAGGGPGIATVCGPIDAMLRAQRIDDRTFVVIVTRGHRNDEQALAAVIERGAAYIGLIGSRRKIKLIGDDLAAEGVSPEALADVRAPIGLDIGSVTVEEIAVSIAAELVEQRAALSRPRVDGPRTVRHDEAVRP